MKQSLALAVALNPVKGYDGRGKWPKGEPGGENSPAGGSGKRTAVGEGSRPGAGCPAAGSLLGGFYQ